MLHTHTHTHTQTHPHKHTHTHNARLIWPVQCHCRMFSNQFAAHYIAENNKITKDLLFSLNKMRLRRGAESGLQ